MDCKRNTPHIIKMHIYCKKCNKHTSNTFPKILKLQLANPSVQSNDDNDNDNDKK